MIPQTLARQVSQVFGTLIESVKRCPDPAFGLTAGELHDSIGRIAMHVGDSIENTFMTDGFREKWRHPVKGRMECIEYLESCRDDLLMPFIEGSDLGSSDEQPEYFISKLDRVMKILRHIAHHTGEIGCLLREMGIQEAPFIG